MKLNQDTKFYLKIALMFAIAIFLLWKDKRSTGSVYAPDMAYSNALETYGESKIPTKVGDSMYYMGARLPVMGSIPRGTFPNDSFSKNEAYLLSYTYHLHFKNNDEDKARAGATLRNPYSQADEKVMARGKAVYTNNCQVCHGAKGMGDGPLIIREDGSDGAYKAVPPAYSDRLKTLKDGEIFHSITYGKNMMGAHGSQVSPDDRWKLICYIKSLGGLPDNHSVVNVASTPLVAATTTVVKEEKKIETK